MNINVFSCFDNEGHARHSLVISRKHYDRVANLLYSKNHYAAIANISRLFSDITNINNQKHFCYARHMKLCTRDDFMSVLYIFPTPGSKHA